MNKKIFMRTVIIVIFALTFIFTLLFWSIYKKIETTAETGSLSQRIETKGPEMPYTIPENAIPAKSDIEERINKNKEKAAALETAIAKTAIVLETQGTENQIQSNATQDTSNASNLPPKKEVKFPTAEERKKVEAQTGIIAY